MNRSGCRLGAVLLLLAARNLPALDMEMQAREEAGTILATCRTIDMDAEELMRSLDAGGTVRLTWHFRLAGADVSVIRFAHRDVLDGGYFIYGDDAGVPSTPLNSSEIIAEMSVLANWPVSNLGDWNSGAVLEGRLFLDTDIDIPPMEAAALYRRGRYRSPWRSAEHPAGGAR